MPRPNLVLGTWGSVAAKQYSKDRWVAYARFRDYDGVTRTVERAGATKQKAKDSLAETLRDRARLAGDDITADSRVQDVAAKWYDDDIDGQRAENTMRWYRHAIDNIIGPGMGNLTLREITVARMDRFLKLVAATRGPGSAKTTKTVLSGMFGLAARHGAMDRNPLRDVANIRRPAREDVRALDLAQLRMLRERMYADRLAVLRDVPEPIDFMLATGVRIGEALAIRWFDLDLEAPRPSVLIRATVVGGHIQERPKSVTSRRKLYLPPWIVEVLLQRNETMPPNDQELVFASERGTVRDPNNLRRMWRELREHGEGMAEFDWVKPHTFRKSVATLAGNTKRASEQLGHTDERTTEQHYIPRMHEGPDLVDVLEQIGAPAETQRFDADTPVPRPTSTDSAPRRKPRSAAG